jgi:hypothetical protein
MAIMICRWENSEDDGIHWMYADQTDPSETLFAIMQRYLTTGETMEILSYRRDTVAGGRTNVSELLFAERRAHADG